MSQTPPQSSALPICCVLNSGVSEPSLGLLSTSTLDVSPLVSSVTCSWYGESGDGAQMWTSTMSRACMTNGPDPAAFVSMPLNAAGSMMWPFRFASVQTGEHAVKTSGSCLSWKSPFGVHFFVKRVRVELQLQESLAADLVPGWCP